MHVNTRRMAVWGLCLAFALVLSYIESLVPYFFGVPGMKLGLPNLAVVLLICLEDARGAAVVNVLRIVLAGFLFGSLFGILFSLSGAAASFLVMVLLKKSGRFGMAGLSIAGGTAHNLGQLLVAVFIVKTSGILYYAPFLVIAGVVTGCAIGITAGAVLPRVKEAYGK